MAERIVEQLGKGLPDLGRLGVGSREVEEGEPDESGHGSDQQSSHRSRNADFALEPQPKEEDVREEEHHDARTGGQERRPAPQLEPSVGDDREPYDQDEGQEHGHRHQEQRASHAAEDECRDHRGHSRDQPGQRVDGRVATARVADFIRAAAAAKPAR